MWEHPLVPKELATKGGDRRGDLHGKVLPARAMQCWKELYGKQGLGVVEDSGIWEGGPRGYRKDSCFFLTSSCSLYSSGKYPNSTL